MHNLRPGGWIEFVNRDGSREEYDSYTCGHCNRIKRIPHGTPPEDLGGMCRMCWKHLCKRCAAEMDRTLKCRPFEQRLEESERRRRPIE